MRGGERIGIGTRTIRLGWGISYENGRKDCIGIGVRGGIGVLCFWILFLLLDFDLGRLAQAQDPEKDHIMRHEMGGVKTCKCR